MNRNTTPYSQLKIFYHPEILEKLLKGERCNPIYIRVKPTNRCNHNCSYCHYRNSYLDLDEYDPSDEIPRDVMLETVACMKEMGVKAVTFSGGGEPLLYPYIVDTMQAVLDAGIDLSIITNGSMLNGKRAEILAKAKWVRISVESVNDDEYCSIRGIKKGSFDSLCENIRSFAKIKNENCEFGINMVVTRENYTQVAEMGRLMKQLGANHVKYSPMCTNDTYGYHESFKDEVSEALNNLQNELNDDKFKIIDLYTADFGDSVIFQRNYKECPIKEFVCVIGANSKIYFCHDKAYLSDGCIGSLKDMTFTELWNSEATSELFRKFDARKICRQHCVYDSRNELMNSFLQMDKNHINFI